MVKNRPEYSAVSAYLMIVFEVEGIQEPDGIVIQQTCLMALAASSAMPRTLSPSDLRRLLQHTI